MRGVEEMHNGHPSAAVTTCTFPPWWWCLPGHHRSTPGSGRARCGARPHTAVAAISAARAAARERSAGHVVPCLGAALWAGSWWPLTVLPLSIPVTQRW